MTIYGMERLNKKLKGIARDCGPEIEKATWEAVNYVHGRVPPYPAPPADSTYRRTGTLGRRITTDVKTIGTQIVGMIGNDVVYAPYVISDEKLADGRGPQAWMHEGRWWTLQNVVRKAQQGITDIYRAMVKRLIKKEE